MNIWKSTEQESVLVNIINIYFSFLQIFFFSDLPRRDIKLSSGFMRLCWVWSNIFMVVTVGETWAAASWWQWETREQEEEDEADGQVPGAGAACGQWCSHARMMPRYHQTPVSSSQSRRITAVNCSFCLCPELTKRDLVIIDWGCYQQHWSFNMKQEKWGAGVKTVFIRDTWYEQLDVGVQDMYQLWVSSGSMFRNLWVATMWSSFIHKHSSEYLRSPAATECW